MPKQTDTIEKVQQAADQLLANGQRPTQQAIRDVIGTGSITTINKGLNIWWLSLSKRVSRQSEHPALPEPVITAASKLWDQALIYSHVLLEKQQVEQEEQSAINNADENKKSLQLQENLFLAQQQNSRLLASNEELIQKKQHQGEKIHDLESLLIQKNAENAEFARLIKQHEILLEKHTTIMPEEQRQILFQAKIELKVSESVVNDLKKSLEKSETQCHQYQQALYDLEKSSMKQIHRLELVIAQQDAKYNNVREQLTSFQAIGR